MPFRRSHQKSHHGCSACKQRRIKCSEERPECSTCLKRKLRCSFLDDHVPTASHSYDLVHRPESYTQQSLVNSDPLPLLELELLHHWHTSAAYAVSQDEQVNRVMRDVIPREGLSHPFLMHGLLAISALHLIQPGNDKDSLVYAKASIQYKQQALSLYAPHLNNITRSNCNALFAFSCLLSIICSASETLDITRTAKGIEDIVGIFRLTRGVAVIVAEARQWIESSEVAILMRPGHFERQRFNSHSNGPPSDVESHLRHLLDLCNDTCKGSISMDTYTSSIQYLIDSYMAHSIAADNTIGLAWPVLVDSRYIDLLLPKDQLSLVILAHYGAVMTLLDDTWWLDRWGRLLIKLASTALHPSWLCKIEWPLQIIEEKES